MNKNTKMTQCDSLNSDPDADLLAWAARALLKLFWNLQKREKKGPFLVC